MQPDFEASVWAVVTAGAEKYIGRLHMLMHLDGVPNSVRLDMALKLVVMDMPIQGPQGQLGFRHIVQGVALDNGMYPATLYVIPTAIRLFKDMHEDDQRGHESLVKATIASLEKARAEAAGIEIPRLIIPPNVRPQ